MTQKRKRLWALLLSAALVTTQLPAVVLAENKTPEDGAVASFAALPDPVKAQTVPTGTEESERHGRQHAGERCRTGNGQRQQENGIHSNGANPRDLEQRPGL